MAKENARAAAKIALAEMPKSFEEFSGPALAVLGDSSFHCDGYQLTSRQLFSNYEGASAAFTADLGPKTRGADLSISFPKPFAFDNRLALLDGFAIDALSLNKDGQASLQCSLNETLHGVPGLTAGVTTDSVSQDLTYWKSLEVDALGDTVFNFQTTQSAPADVTAAWIYGGLAGSPFMNQFMGYCVIGTRFNGTSTWCPDVGLSTRAGQFFTSLVAEKKFSELKGSALVNVTDDISVAASCQLGGKDSGTWAAGGWAALSKKTSANAKLESSNNLSLTVKQEITKGTSFLAGCRYNIKTGDSGFGARFCVE